MIFASKLRYDDLILTSLFEFVNNNLKKLPKTTSEI